MPSLVKKNVLLVYYNQIIKTKLNNIQLPRIFSIFIGTSSSFTKNVVTIEPVLVTREDSGNVSSASTLVSNPTSIPSSAAFFVGWPASAAPSTGLGGVVERVVDCLVEKKGVVCGVRGVVWSLGPTTP